MEKITMSTMPEFYVSQSAASSPGTYAHLFDGLSPDLAAISHVTQGLVHHYFSQPPAERLGEIDTRYIERILARIAEMNHRPLTEARPTEQRFIGCCRDFSLIACAILRQQGRPARLRYGFANYFVPNYWMDHVVVEVWEGNRWVRFDPEIAASDFPATFDGLDMPASVFVTGGRAWQMCRDQGADATQFGIGHEVRDVGGWDFIRGRLLLDVAALNKQELLCWDVWGLGLPQHDQLSTEDVIMLDRVALLSQQADSTAVLALVESDPHFSTPETVTCFSPARGPHEVALSPA